MEASQYLDLSDLEAVYLKLQQPPYAAASWTSALDRAHVPSEEGIFAKQQEGHHRPQQVISIRICHEMYMSCAINSLSTWL
jgi:hypothetical protein